MRYGELFSGAGGMSLGLERAGLSCAFHAEIADFPRRILQHRFPAVPLYGDVSTLDGRQLVRDHGSIDLLAGGSPCQDLSVAGKRLGLSGARSGLFYEQIRLWEETGATYLLWENVAGALSSNRGADFARVLSAVVGGDVAVPPKGWKRSGGVVAGPRGVAAWRCLDAQYFGVPQRRLRVFVLGARAGGVDPAAVLLEPEGVRRDPPTRREAGEGTAAGAAGCVGFQSSQSGFRSVETFATLDANYGARRHNGVLAFHQTQDPISGAECSPALGTTTSGMGVLSAPIIASVAGHGGYTLGRPTLGASGGDCAGGSEALVVGALDSREHGGGFPGSDGAMAGHVQPSNGVPRRLMPIECERLMGWPDGWTDVPDERGKPASDAQRYKACGNGVVSNVAEWIGRRLVALEAAATLPVEAAA